MKNRLIIALPVILIPLCLFVAGAQTRVQTKSVLSPDATLEISPSLAPHFGGVTVVIDEQTQKAVVVPVAAQRQRQPRLSHAEIVQRLQVEADRQEAYWYVWCTAYYEGDEEKYQGVATKGGKLNIYAEDGASDYWQAYGSYRTADEAAYALLLALRKPPNASPQRRDKPKADCPVPLSGSPISSAKNAHAQQKPAAVIPPTPVVYKLSVIATKEIMSLEQQKAALLQELKVLNEKERLLMIDIPEAARKNCKPEGDQVVCVVENPKP